MASGAYPVAIGFRPLVDPLEGLGQVVRIMRRLDHRSQFAIGIEQGEVAAVIHQQLAIHLPVHEHSAQAFSQCPEGVEIAGQAVEVLTEETGVGFEFLRGVVLRIGTNQQ